MEDQRIEKRKEFFKIKVDDPKLKREAFQISLRSKRKQQIFKKKRNIASKLSEMNHLSELSEEKTLPQLSKELTILTSEKAWELRIFKILHMINAKLIKSEDSEVLDFAKEPELSMTLHLILKSLTDNFFSKSIDDEVLNNTAETVSIYLTVSEKSGDEISLFVNNTQMLCKTLSSLLKLSLWKLTTSTHSSQITYYSELVLNLLDIFSNLIYEFGDDFKQIILDVDIFNNLKTLVGSDISRECTQSLVYFLHVLSFDIRLPANIVEVVLEIYASVLSSTDNIESIELLDKASLTLIKDIIEGMKNSVNDNETALRGFIDNDVCFETFLMIVEQISS